MIRKIVKKLGFIEEKPMDPKLRIKKQKADLKVARELAKRKGRMRELSQMQMANAGVELIVNNCVQALDLAAARGHDTVTAYIKLTSKPVTYFTQKHWKSIVKTLTEYGYQVRSSCGPCVEYDVTKTVSRTKSWHHSSRPGPIRGGMPTTVIDDDYRPTKVTHCYYLISLPY
jgi:hypothetical protein